MPVTRKFRTNIRDRALNDPAYRREMLTEAVNELLAGDLDAGKAMLRDYINATITFQQLAKKLKKSDKSEKSSDELVAYWAEGAQQYPIVSLEDGLAESPPADIATLTRFHDPAYVAALHEADVSGHVSIVMRRRYNLGTLENPVFPGVFARAATAVGGSILAARKALEGRVAYHPAGGTHHAKRGAASGFCYFNDPVFAILTLLDAGLGRVLYVDLDAHHGDGVEDAFAADSRVFTISIHEVGRWPHTGAIGDRRDGRARNLPVPRGVNDSEFNYLIAEAVLPLAQRFAPQALVITAGADPLAGDPLSKMMLSNGGLLDAVMSLAAVAQPRGVLGGRGLYRPAGPPVAFVIEKADWAIRWVGEHVCEGIEREAPGTAAVTVRPERLVDRVVHFGSQYMWLAWGGAMARSNRYVVSFFHGKREDGAQVARHIDAFLESVPRLSRIVTACSVSRAATMSFGTAFFEPRTGTVPYSGDPPVMCSVSSTVIEVCAPIRSLGPSPVRQPRPPT